MLRTTLSCKYYLYSFSLYLSIICKHRIFGIGRFVGGPVFVGNFFFFFYIYNILTEVRNSSSLHYVYIALFIRNLQYFI